MKKMMKFQILIIYLVLITSNLITTSPIEKYLLDSTQSQTELNWDKEAFGDSAELPGWKEQSFSQKNGDVWRVHFVCDIASSNPNNWLRLPYIYREQANRLLIKLEYTIRECKKYPGDIRSCKETFQLLYIESDNNNTSGDFTESNYKYLKTIASNNVYSSSASSSSSDSTTTPPLVSQQPTTLASSSSIYRTEVELPLRTDKQGVYLVFRDQGACVSLLSVKIYYTVCSAQVNNLIEFPETPTGSNATDLVQRTGKCIENAVPIGSSNSAAFAYCQTNGNWFITNENNGMCACLAGYYYAVSPPPQANQCIQCPPGKYKADISNQLECLSCPLNSWSHTNGSQVCSCLNGFFRINSTDFSTDCIQYPNEPKNLTIYYLDQASIKLRWNPIQNYENSKLIEYKLDCFKCKDDSISNSSSTTTTTTTIQSSLTNSICKDRQVCDNYVRKQEISENKIELNSLDSNTQYLIEIYAKHKSGLFKTKTVDIMVRTYQDLNWLSISNLTAYQFTEINQILLVWSLTSNNNRQSQATILNYELRYWPSNNNNDDAFSKANVITIKAPANNFTLKNSNPNVINKNLYVFQLRCQSSNGWGPFTPPIESMSISNFLYRSNMFQDEQQLQTTLAYEINTSDLKKFNTMKTHPFTNTIVDAIQKNSNKTDNLTTIIMSTAVALCFIIVIMSLLIYLHRSNKSNCFYMTKKVVVSATTTVSSSSNTNSSKNPVITSSSNSDCDSIDFAKRTNAIMAYNQLNGTCSAGGTTSRSSGGSSPIWPPLNSFKTYIDPHTYEDPTKVVGLFAKELSPSNIIIESVIGGGEFGDVCKGCLRITPWSENIVAIKTLKGAATEQNRCDFLTEASIMAQFKDPNVVRLEGVVTMSHPLMIVTEYMENGSLDTFLRLHENKLKITQMLKILRDVASGMRYLSDMNYIHRDLAARNILISRDLTCKVADFGLSRALDNDSLEYTTKGGKIPIRWTAPEACNFRKYSYASDVWSFGVLAYEVLSFGDRPYWNWENTDVIKAIHESYRLPPPNMTPECLYKLMLRCWNDDRLLRPRFIDIVTFLDEISFNCTVELNTPARIKELMPINPRSPTQIQLTSTKQFLKRLKLEHHFEMFHKHGLANLSNLFQLEVKDLVHYLNVTNTYEQKIILDELKRISDVFLHSVSNQANSFIFFHNNNNNNNNSNNNNSFSQQQQQRIPTQQNSSIFQLIRNNSLNKSQINNDLLQFTTSSTLSHHNQPLNNNGFLV